MNWDLHQILASKRRFRRDLEARDILGKLAMLDALRQRTLALRGDRFPPAVSDCSTVLREDFTPYRIDND
jgi:hypothetical protein